MKNSQLKTRRVTDFLTGAHIEQTVRRQGVARRPYAEGFKLRVAIRCDDAEDELPTRVHHAVQELRPEVPPATDAERHE